jgi:hypothetical protein
MTAPWPDSGKLSRIRHVSNQKPARYAEERQKELEKEKVEAPEDYPKAPGAGK